MSIKNLNSKVPEWLRSNSFLTSLLSVMYCFLLYKDRNFRKALNDNIEQYKNEGTKRNRIYLKTDMLKVYIQNWMTPFEYRCFDFASKTANERSTYISEKECVSYFKDKRINFLPNDKYQRFVLFQNLFHRDVIVIHFDGTAEDQAQYQHFCETHKSAICKPIMGTKGKGVHRIDLHQVSTINELKSLVGGACLLEQEIKQGKELSKFHPQSVNTLRFVSGLSAKGKFSLLYALFRTGCNGSVVDNVGAGGIISLVDKNGVICTDGMRGAKYFTKHPNSGVQYRGTQIPEWNTLCKIVEEAHKSFAKQKFLGWDFAWTTEGWDLVEVNPAPAFASYQILMGKGVKPILKDADIIEQ